MRQDIKFVTQEVEYGLIGALLHSQLNAAARDVLNWLEPEMFVTFNLGVIYKAIRNQARKDNVIDIILLNSDYGQDLATLAEIMRNTVTAANLTGYAEKLHTLYRRREANKIFLEVASEINQATDEKLNDITEKGLNNLTKLMSQNSKVKPEAINDLLVGYVDLLEERTKPSFKARLLFTGVTALDNKLGGIGDTDICVIAGRAGNGKTETAITITKNIIESGGPVLFFSLEMSKEQILDRLISSISGVNSVNLRNPENLRDEDFARMSTAIQALQQQPLFIVDKGGLSATDIIAIAEAHLQQHGKLKAIVIDYIGLVRHGDLTGKINKTYLIEQSVESLKTFSKDHHVPVILLSQLNRDAEQSRPKNSDLSDSKSLEQVASQIVMVHNQRDKNTNEPAKYTEWIVTKNRFGSLGTVYVEFNHGRFLECDQISARNAITAKEVKYKPYAKRGDI